MGEHLVVGEVELGQRTEAAGLGDGGAFGNAVNLIALGVQLLQGGETRHVGGQRRDGVLRNVQLLQIHKLAQSLVCVRASP